MRQEHIHVTNSMRKTSTLLLLSYVQNLTHGFATKQLWRHKHLVAWQASAAIGAASPFVLQRLSNTAARLQEPSDVRFEGRRAWPL